MRIGLVLAYSLPNRSTSRTLRVAALAIVTQNCSRRKTVRHTALIVFASFHVTPEPFHIRTMLGNCTPPILSCALGRVMQEKQPLLLVTYSVLDFRIRMATATGVVGTPCSSTLIVAAMTVAVASHGWWWSTHSVVAHWMIHAWGGIVSIRWHVSVR